ncbi:MAG: Rab family GTPase, partial [Promethearchaeota archaeon]
MIISEINIKLVIFGLGGVGKTSIVNSFLGNQISTKYFPTIGSSISKKEYRLPKNIIRVNIWDIGGQRAFNPLNPVFFTNNDAAFLVFDLSNPGESIKELMDVYLPSLGEKSENCFILVLGNKLDLITNDEELRRITRENAIQNLPFAYVSAL